MPETGGRASVKADECQGLGTRNCCRHFQVPPRLVLSNRAAEDKHTGTYDVVVCRGILNT